MKEILTLKGVARKTANVVLGNAYGIVDGIAVDTHVIRLSQRLGISYSDKPIVIERDLMEIIPKKDWFQSTYFLIEHGRAICTAKDPRCDLCPLYSEYLPVYSLEVAASAFREGQHAEISGWRRLSVPSHLTNGHFIAKVVGKSMEPTIPDGSYCVFRKDRGGSRNGLVVLVESKRISDPENGQGYTVKRYHSEKELFADGTWRHKKIVLSPDNKHFEDIVLEGVLPGEFHIVAEFICCL
jgi:hypothetical protein